MKTKITAPNGKYSIITTRDQENTFDCSINHVSSTEAQPYIAVNFTDAGVAVGGRTMQESAVQHMIASAKGAGFKIEEI